MFVYAPDTHIQEHLVKIANGEWTSVIGIMEGTFTKPMPIGEVAPVADLVVHVARSSHAPPGTLTIEMAPSAQGAGAVASLPSSEKQRAR